MESKNLPGTPSPRPVMDIRPQRTAPPTVNRPTVSPPPRSSFSAAPQPGPAPDSAPQPAPSPDTVVPAPAEPTPPATGSNELNPGAKETPPPPTSVNKVPPLAPGTRAPRAVIAVALIVGLSLAGLTVFAYLKDSNRASPAVSDHTGHVQPEEVDTSIKAVEDELNTLDDDTDFNDTDINDETLGL